MIKLFELEEDASVYLLLDSSRSMESKFLYARKLAAALGYIALKSLDRLAVYGLADSLDPLLESCRGSAKTLQFHQSYPAEYRLLQTLPPAVAALREPDPKSMIVDLPVQRDRRSAAHLFYYAAIAGLLGSVLLRRV